MMKFLLVLVSSLISLVPAAAQVEIRLAADRNTYLEQEGIGLNLVITNRSGADIELKSIGQQSWLDFKVTSGTGEIIAPIRRELFQRVVVPRGASVSKRVPLTRFYSLTQTGKYSVRANVNLGNNTSFTSGGAHFTIVTAPAFWSKRIGVPEGQPGSGNIRLYSLKRAVVERTNRLFLQIDDETTGQTITVIQLGQALSSSDPIPLIDKNQTFHVLFQNTSVLYVHTTVDIHGDYQGHVIYKRLGSRPRLVLGPEGKAVVVGGVIFDPQAEQQAKGQIRKLSERPSFHYR